MPDTRDYGLFIDGGVTPHNNPSFALLQMVTLKPFRICWPVGPDRLSVTSIGTGTFRPRLSYRELGFARFPQLAYHALMSLMTDAEILVHAADAVAGRIAGAVGDQLRDRHAWRTMARPAARCSGSCAMT